MAVVMGAAMIQLQALRFADALVGRARQLLRDVEIAGHITLEATEAKEFAAELIDIARAIMLATDSAAAEAPAPSGADIIDFTLRRRLRLALATAGAGDVA